MKISKKLKSLFYVCILSILVSCPFNYISIYGNSTNLRTRQQQINNETQAIRDSLDVVYSQMTEEQQRIYEIEQELMKVISELHTIERELDTTRKILEETTIELERAVILREEQQERLVSRARFMHMNGRMRYIDIFLNASSISDLLRRIDYVNRIVENDQNLVSELRATEELIGESLQVIYIQEQNLQALEAQQISRKSEYELIKSQRVAFLNKLEEEERTLLEEMWVLEEANREIENLIRAAERAAQRSTAQSSTRMIVDTSNLNGIMAWPVPGWSRISSGYGNRPSPITGRNEFHTGIDIPAPAGTNIISTDSGTVIFSGWMNGYGNTIIVDHGNGISTLYAHNSRNLVSVGQSVERGQVIGEVGTTGNSTGNHLHYEVRINGSHTDPMQFLN